MAWMETHYYSFSMGSNITLNVIVPTPTSSEQIVAINHSEKYDYEKGLPVVYLLHGAYGDAFSWIRFSNIDRYAQERGVVVVMADGGLSFYQNLRSGRKFEDFFTKELPAFIEGVFPVSKKREEHFIAGFSMGGYGAWYLALKHPELYAKSASMSGAVDIAGLYETQKGKTVEDNNPFNWEDSFGDQLSQLAGSDYDLMTLYDKAKAQGMVPKLYQSVGYQDFLYESSQGIRKALENRKADFLYEEGEGGHDWNFWDKNIQRVLDWMLEK